MPLIKKDDVTTAVAWVEIPDINLRVLCGCPPDSVKHLMKRGLCRPMQTDGVQYETGPNAILLSDSMIQQGEFSNLAEFPVLQMLYRQGLFLPNHPNNTGVKPLLMGSEAQVQAQLRYIYRGNYGLIDKAELREAGMSAKRAETEMRAKLRFAFGSIRPTSDFMDTVAIGSAPAEIGPGATVARVGHNVFEFRYKGETARVDLNLPDGGSYPLPYTLTSHNIRREYFAVINAGNGDGWSVDRPTMSSVIMFQGGIYLVDAGPNLSHVLTALGIGVNEIRGIFHTHAHDDHFCGMTTLMQADHRIEHYATPAVRSSIAKKWGALLTRPESEFAHYFEVHDLRERRWNDIRGLEVKPFYSPHPVETTCMAFRAKAPDGYRTYAHLSDIANRRVLDGFLEEDLSKPGMTRRVYDQVWKDYLAPADLKKIDIGGGLVHGDAEDFTDDRSERIILAHTGEPLTDSQKVVGSQTEFGSVEVLISGTQNYLRALAYRYLQANLPTARQHELQMLMNAEIETFPPQTLLLKRGERRKHVHLVLTGVVDMIDTARGASSTLSAGTLIGEMSAYTDSPSRSTFRTRTHVQAMRLPRSLFVDVLGSSGMGEVFGDLLSVREFLQGTWLFSHSLSTAVQNRLISSMLPMRFPRGRPIMHGNDPAIYIVHQGEVELRYGERAVATVGEGGFFGEGYVLFNTPCLTIPTPTTDTDVLIVHRDAVQHIPSIRWKLYETFCKRAESIIEATVEDAGIFQWRDEYATGVEWQDQDHKELLDKSAMVFRAISLSDASLAEALADLREAIEQHARRELKVYDKAEFPEIEHHTHLHDELKAEFAAKAERLLKHPPDADVEFLSLVKNWLIDHFMTEDRKFGLLMELRRQSGKTT